MDSTESIPHRLRAADADRERVAATVQTAGAQGRLTLTETDERLAEVYATTYVDQLTALTADLPQPAQRNLSARWRTHRALRVHAAIVVALSILLVVRWAASGVPYFWPVAPLFWLTLSLLVHAKVRGVVRQRADVVA